MSKLRSFESIGRTGPAVQVHVVMKNEAGCARGRTHSSCRGASARRIRGLSRCDDRVRFGAGVFCALLCAVAAIAAGPALAEPASSATSSGGAIANDGAGGASSPTLTNVTFSGNSAAASGGAMYNDGSAGGTSNPFLINVTFSANQAGATGGAIHDDADGGTCNPGLINVILWGDTAPSASEIGNVSAHPVFANSIVQGSGGSGAGWDTGVGIDFNGNLDADPLLGALADNGGDTRTLLPAIGSAAIDAGDDGDCPATDQRGMARPQGAHCDIGAVEVRPDVVFADGFDGL